MINLDGKESKRTHWVSLFIDRNTAVYLLYTADSFRIEYIHQEVLKSKINQSLTIYLEHKAMISLCVDFIILL